MITCKICQQQFDKRISFCNHIFRIHGLSGKEYYDTYLKQEGDGICHYEGCQNTTSFINIEKGYKECCCLEHTNLFRYGVKSNLNFEEIKAKAKQNSHTEEALSKQAKTNMDRYGTRTPLQNKEILKHTQELFMERYGVISPFKLDSVKEKIKKVKTANKLRKRIAGEQYDRI